MKTIFRFLSLGLLLTGMMAVGTTAIFAQDPCADADGQTALYTKFTAIYNKKTVPEMEAALAAGKEFLEKYGACEPLKEQIDFVKPHVARLETAIPVEKKRIEMAPFFKRFDEGIGTDGGINAKVPDEVYAAGKEILARQPDNLNIIVPLGLVGLYESYKNNNKFADDALKYAQTALSQLKAGKEANRKNKAGVPVYGVLKYELPKEDLISELTYAIGYLNFYAKKDVKAALPYYYELSQSAGRYKKEPRIYATIGNYYIEQRKPIGEEIAKLIALQKGTDTDEVKLAREGEIKAKIALFNGFSERALDAFGRAYTVAPNTTPADKTYKDGLYKTVLGLYEQRFEKKVGLDEFIAATVAKPLPNPTSEVTPVVDPEPVKTTTTTSTTPATAKSAVVIPTKPVSATTKVSANEKSVVTAPSDVATAAKAKTFAKKPVMKRKGTR